MSLGLALGAARLERCAVLDSASLEAARRAALGERGPLWITPERQTAGRGRMGRAWESPPGNLLTTLLFAPPVPPAGAALFAFAAGLALAEAADGFVAPALVSLKWPNDLLIDGHKAAGILLESAGGATGLVDWLSIGVGVNIAAAPPPEATRWPATRLNDYAAAPVEPLALLRAFAARLDHWAGRLVDEGFSPVRAAWRGRAHGLGGSIQARLAAETREGTFQDIDVDGALMLRREGRVERINAADVHFPQGVSHAARH